MKLFFYLWNTKSKFKSQIFIMKLQNDTEKRLQVLQEELKKEQQLFNSIESSSKEPRAFAIASRIGKLEKEITELSASLMV